jgi:FMN phosphatase YigB (HAD superfamily)
MRWQAICFDLDGTLVPMDTETFTNGYFKGLVKKLAPFGLEPDALVGAVWKGTKAMVKNEGPATNETVFWDDFARTTGLDPVAVNEKCIEFYGNEFDEAVRFTNPTPLAKKAVEAARGHADTVVLATNPIFPLVAQKTRLGWAGLVPQDFDAVTSYETQTCCKPNPAYYTRLCDALGLDPARCLMVGNDELEDMYAATAAGMQAFLVTGSAIPSAEHPWTGPRGDFTDLIGFFES